MKNQLVSLSSFDEESSNSRSSFATTQDFSQRIHLTWLYLRWMKRKFVKALPKKFTPLLVFTFILPLFFKDMFSEEQTLSPILQIGLLLFLQINAVFINFALRNYFEGRKITRIWLIESIIIFITVYFLI